MFKLPSFAGDSMRDSIQKLLDELTSLNDPRVSVFDIQFKGLDKETLSLSGKLLDQDQLAALEGAFSNHFPSLSLNTASVQILSREPREHVHVATNLTGFYIVRISVKVSRQMQLTWCLHHPLKRVVNPTRPVKL
jgi:hypothetical protein